MTLPSVLLPYQAAWILDESRVKVCEKSRQIGMSWVCALEAVLYASSERKRAQVSYIGYNAVMARNFIDDCIAWARILRVVVEADDDLIDPKTGFGRYSLRFRSGATIQALSSRPENFRSRGGLGIIDEAAFHADLPGLLKAVVPFLVWGGRVAILSTHNGTGSAFAKLIEDIRAGKTKYSLHRTTFDEAVAVGLYKRICEAQQIEWTEEREREWVAEIYALAGTNADEELRCIPSRSGGQYFDPGTIEVACSGSVRDAPVIRWAAPKGFAQRPDEERKAVIDAWIKDTIVPQCVRVGVHETCVLGEDFGRVADLTGIVIMIADVRGRCRVPLIVELRDTPYQQQVQVIRALVSALKVRRISCDATGNGGYVAERCVQLYGESMAKAQTITRAWYGEAMPPLRAALEDRTLSLPRDRGVISDLATVRVVDGLPSIPAAKVKRPGEQSRHGDLAIAIALAYAEMRVLTYGKPLDRSTRVRPEMSRTQRARSGISRGGGLW